MSGSDNHPAPVWHDVREGAALTYHESSEIWQTFALNSATKVRTLAVRRGKDSDMSDSRYIKWLVDLVESETRKVAQLALIIDRGEEIPDWAKL